MISIIAAIGSRMKRIMPNRIIIKTLKIPTPDSMVMFSEIGSDKFMNILPYWKDDRKIKVYK